MQSSESILRGVKAKVFEVFESENICLRRDHKDVMEEVAFKMSLAGWVRFHSVGLRGEDMFANWCFIVFLIEINPFLTQIQNEFH